MRERNWPTICPDCGIDMLSKHAWACPPCSKIRRAKWLTSEKIQGQYAQKKKRRERRKQDPVLDQHLRTLGTETLRRMRRKVLVYYSADPPYCNCCGEAEYKFLSLDHINGRQGKPRPSDLARWLVQNNYPSGFQVLCYNCNCAKGYWGHCPHLSQQIE